MNTFTVPIIYLGLINGVSSLHHSHHLVQKVRDIQEYSIEYPCGSKQLPLLAHQLSSQFTVPIIYLVPLEVTVVEGQRTEASWGDGWTIAPHSLPPLNNSDILVKSSTVHFRQRHTPGLWALE